MKVLAAGGFGALLVGILLMILGVRIDRMAARLVGLAIAIVALAGLGWITIRPAHPVSMRVVRTSSPSPSPSASPSPSPSPSQSPSPSPKPKPTHRQTPRPTPAQVVVPIEPPPPPPPPPSPQPSFSASPLP